MTKNNNKNEKFKSESAKRKLVSKVRLAQLVDEQYKKYEKSFYQLTKREKQVLRFTALGFDSKEIGRQLSISKHTIDTHRKNIYKKTELKNLRDIILFALTFDLSL